MFKPNGIVLPFILLFISTSIFFQKSLLVCGSSVKEQMLKRPDPLLNFKAYNGDYDIQNKHYWAWDHPFFVMGTWAVNNFQSAIYTGLHGYVIAGVWLLFGLGFSIYVIVRSLCCTSSSPLNEHSDNYYIILFTLAVLFTLLAVLAGSLAIATEEMSISKTRRLIDTVLNAGVSARRSIQRINNVLREMETLLQPYDGNVYHILNSTRSVLETQSQTIRYFVLKSNSLADGAVQLLHVANIVLAVIYLSLLLAGFVQLFMHWKPGFVIIIFFLWSLTTINWLMTGFDFFFHTFIRDTCTAFAEYKPDQNTSLGNLLPCGKTAASDKILVEVGSTIHDFVTELNSKLRILRYIFNENRREGLLGLEICDPFPIPPTNHSIAPQACSKDVTPITDLSDVLARYTCYENNSTSYCIREGKYIPHIAFIVAWAYSKSIEELVNVYPDAQSLSQCTPVLEALSNVVTHQCKPLKASIGMLWSSMLCLSIIMLLLTLVLVAKAYQDWRRRYSLCSIIPTHVHD